MASLEARHVSQLHRFACYGRGQACWWPSQSVRDFFAASDVDIIELNHIVVHSQNWGNQQQIEVSIGASYWLFWRLDLDGEYRIHDWSRYSETTLIDARLGSVKVESGAATIRGRVFVESYTRHDRHGEDKAIWPHEIWARTKIPGLR